MSDYRFSTKPLKDLFDFYGVTYEVETITRKDTRKTWVGKFIVRSYDDTSPILERQGWHQWLTALLRSNPTKWYLGQVSIIGNLPQSYRGRLPTGYIPRDALPVSADLKRAHPFPPICPTEPDEEGIASSALIMKNREAWNDLKKTYLFHNVFLYKRTNKIRFLES